MQTALVQLDALRMKLAQIEEPGEVKHIRDRAEALRAYAKTRGESLLVQNEFAEVKLIAERRAGEMLAGTEWSKGGRPSETGDTMSPVLDEYGVTKKQSSRWQQEASIPEETFLRYVAETKAAGEELTSAGLLRLARMGVHYSSDRLDWGTPQAFFDQLDEEFGFTLDVCATEETAKCERYFSPEEDGLAQEWSGVCWMNPPYGNEIGDWIGKAYFESRGEALVVCLIPSRTDTAWWHDYVMKAKEIRFLRGRLKFEGAASSAPFPSAVVVLQRGFEGPPVVAGILTDSDEGSVR